jgi:hypothetical protein
LISRVHYFLVVFILCMSCFASDGSFDLSGPQLEMTVTRAGKVLPVSEVPNLQPGDRLWIHPAFPDNESVHYLLVVAFLQGATNPPPDKWFTKAETWTREIRQEGTVVTVPEYAQQALIFLAPQTGGDFSTLRSAVEGKPGAFVRAAQDLNLAGQSRLRVEKYLSAIREYSGANPDTLHERTTLLARSLKLKIDEGCFDKPAEQQLSCLTQNTDQMVLDDGHGQSMLEAMSSGPGVDLLGAASAQVRGGVYSPYVGVIVDMVKVMSSLHTAQYQYLPALALPKKDQLNLRLNNPPSFHKPQSVLVVALPPVHEVPVPSLKEIDPEQVHCVQNASAGLPVDGAPLVFATAMAHDFTLHLHDDSGKALDVPVRPDASHGGFVVEGRAPKYESLGTELTGTLHGSWGFETFEGPTFHLRNAPAAVQWTLSPKEEQNLIAGRDDTFRLQSEIAPCVEDIAIKDQHDKPLKTSWKLVEPDAVEVRVSLAEHEPGGAKLSLKQFGLTRRIDIPVRTYAEEGRIDSFVIHVGDQQGVLKGALLDQVERLEINGTQFLPATLTHAGQAEELSLAAKVAAAPVFQSEQKLTAQVTLKDGRAVEVQTNVEPPRSKVALISKHIESFSPAIHLGNPNDLPLHGEISFFVKSDVPASFPPDQKIEVSTVDGTFHTLLSVANKNLSFQDPQTAVAVLNPLEKFGAAAFGPLQFRPIAADGTAGDWQSLARLVRVPDIKDVHCPDDPAKPCALSGDMLYLITSISSNADFSNAASVPSGFADNTLTVPRPYGTLLYLKLRDDPDTVNTATLPVLPEQ